MNRPSHNTLSNIYWGLVLIAIGGIFLARNMGYIDFEFSMKQYWPVILILIGISIIIKHWSRPPA